MPFSNRHNDRDRVDFIDSRFSAKEEEQRDSITDNEEASSSDEELNRALPSSPSHHHQQQEEQPSPRHYSVSELVRTLGNNNNNSTSTTSTTTELPPELERRVLDFRLAQEKRCRKYGTTKKWGIFGMYAHLANVRIDLEWAEDAAWRRQHGEPYLAWTDFDDARLRGLRNRPWFTYTVVLVCTIMLLVEFGVNGWEVAPLSVNPMIGPSAETLIKVGARQTELIVEQGQWFRIFSPLILHAGIIHYLVNMTALWFIGAAVEQSHGIVNTTVLFVIPGVGGNILSAIFLPEFISVGASGGIFGLIGGCIADIALNWKLLFIKNAEESEGQVWRRNFFAVTFLVAEIMINIILGLVTPFIDNWAHLGGMVYGACCAFSMIERLPVGFFGVNTSTWDKIQAICVKFCGLIITLVLILVSTVYLATSDPGESPCEGCRYISCVPFPFFSENKWWYCDDCDFTTALLSSQDDIWTKVDLNCPDESVATINITSEQLTEKQDVVRNLPTYCREYCDSVFD